METTKELLQKVINKRDNDSYKGTYGRVLLIGGLYPYGGAIIMAATACVNSGAGLVTVATDKENIMPLYSHLPEAMAFAIDDLPLMKQNLEASDVILIGPGLGESSRSKMLLKQVMQVVSDEQILIIDGSALNVLANIKQVHFETNHLILTPHQKEWERLSGITIAEQTDEKTKEALSHFPNNSILVAKSHETSVFQGEHDQKIEAGGPHQSIGGMGDTLAGMIAGFSAQFRENLFDTVVAATYLHSLIADELALNAYVVRPTQISSEIPRWMRQIVDEEKN